MTENNPRIYIVQVNRSAWVEVNGKIKTTSTRLLARLAIRDCRKWVKKHHPNNTNTRYANLTR